MSSIMEKATALGPADQEKLAAAVALLRSNKGEFEVVRIDELEVDQRYQRELSRDLAARIADNYDVVVAGPILVNRREDGTLYIVNGQHRTYAAQSRGETEMLAIVLEGLGPAEEAALRLQSNVGRQDTSLEKFKSRIVAGDEIAVAIAKLVDSFEIQVNLDSPNAEVGLNAVAALEEVYRVDYGVTLAEVFKLTRESFGRADGQAGRGDVLKAGAWFLLHHRNEYDRGRLVGKLELEGVSGLTRSARALRAAIGGPMWLNIYRAFVEAYNLGLRDHNKLDFRTKGNSPGHGGFKRSGEQ